jgi:hypothetical protein
VALRGGLAQETLRFFQAPIFEGFLGLSQG